jgi:hypothetical protein
LTNCGKKTGGRKWKRQNIIEYATWNIRGIAHKEEMDCVLNEKQTKIAAITEPKKKLKGTLETNNYILIQWCRQKFTSISRCKIHKSIKNTIVNCIYWSERIIEIKLNIGRNYFLESTPQNKGECKKTKTVITSGRKN